MQSEESTHRITSTHRDVDLSCAQTCFGLDMPRVHSGARDPAQRGISWPESVASATSWGVC